MHAVPSHWGEPNQKGIKICDGFFFFTSGVGVNDTRSKPMEENWPRVSHFLHVSPTEFAQTNCSFSLCVVVLVCCDQDYMSNLFFLMDIYDFKVSWFSFHAGKFFIPVPAFTNNIKHGIQHLGTCILKSYDLAVCCISRYFCSIMSLNFWTGYWCFLCEEGESFLFILYNDVLYQFSQLSDDVFNFVRYKTSTCSADTDLM